MQVKVKRVSDNATLPTKREGDAGFDLVAVSERLDPGGFTEFGTGLSFEIPEGYVGLVFPRSSVSKINMSLSNAVGVIDSSYRGEVTARFKPSTTGKGKYVIGDRICQLVILPLPDVELVESDDLSITERGSGGYGSTGA